MNEIEIHDYARQLLEAHGARAVAEERGRRISVRARVRHIQAHGVEGRIGNPEVEILGQERMLKRGAGFEVVFALHIGHI